MACKLKQVEEKEFPPVPRDTPQYKEGLRSFGIVRDVDDGPYPAGHGKRTGWMTGYLDARTKFRLGHIFHKYGLPYP